MGSALDDLLRLFSASGRSSQGAAPGAAQHSAPLTPDARAAAMQAARLALAPKQSDESHLTIRQFGPDGSVLQKSEEWIHGAAGLKAVTNEVRVLTSTGELVEPKEVRIICMVCGGQDNVVTHCRCGVALCRCCLRRDPGDGTALCPRCAAEAIASFNTWVSHDQQQRAKEGSK